MTLDDYKRLNGSYKLSIDMMSDKSDRTLLIGRNDRRQQLHVYIKDHELQAVLYAVEWKNNKAQATDIRKLDMSEENALTFDIPFVFYPALCDFEFCQLLVNKQIKLHFTAYETHEGFAHSPVHNTFDNSLYYGFTPKRNLVI